MTSPVPGASPGAARLGVQDVVVSFGGVRAVDGVTLEVEPGAVAGLIGANGSGKTTLLDAVSGMVAVDSGSVLLDGEDIGDHLPEERAALGVVRSFQECRLFPELSVEDALLVTADGRSISDVVSTTLQLPWARRSERAKRKAVDEAMSSFRLDRFRNHQIRQLSTGTRRVVDLAAVAMAQPRLLLLDEPTSGIAQREAEAFVPLLQGLHEATGSTILIVEHDVPLVFELCSTVVVMQAGEVVSSGSPEVVRRDPCALEAYLGASEEALLASGPLAGGPADPGPATPDQPGGRAGP